MKDVQILSAFQPLPPGAPGEVVPPALVFDACHVGVVLRAVLFVEVVVSVGALYGATTWGGWVTQVALITGGALPATLLWLVVACSFKRLLARASTLVQQLVGVGLGALAGLYGCAMLTLVGFVEPAPWLASACTGALLAGLLVIALIWRAKGKTPAATTARLAELQARIRPHFLFNTLNSAIALVRAEPAQAEALLEDLSDLFRYALVEQGESVTLDQEIALARHYLAIEQVRFGERMAVAWSLDPLAGEARLPPLLLQPLVENAVKHGVETCAQGALIRISTQRRGAVVVVKVRNTVPAGGGTGGQGVALRNVRDRLALLHDVQGQFQVLSKSGEFLVRIEVPL